MREKLIQIVEYLGANVDEFANELASLTCRNCKRWDDCYGTPNEMGYCYDLQRGTSPDFFCAHFASK